MNNFYKNGEVVVYVLVKYCLSTDVALFAQLLFSPIGKKKALYRYLSHANKAFEKQRSKNN